MLSWFFWGQTEWRQGLWGSFGEVVGAGGKSAVGTDLSGAPWGWLMEGS